MPVLVPPPHSPGEMLTRRLFVDLLRTQARAVVADPVSTPASSKGYFLSMNTASTSTRADARPTRRLRLPSFGVQVLIGLALGVVLGLVARAMGPDSVDAAGVADPNWLTETLTTVGGVFVTLLRTIVPPLVFLAIVASIANLRDVTGAARLAWKTLAWFAITALIAVAIGMALGLVLQPGDHASVSADAASAPSTTGSWLDFLTGLVPANVLGLEGSAGDDGSVGLSFNVLQILVVAIAVGIATLKVGADADPFLGVVRSALAVVQKVLWWVILLAPIATVGLLGNAVATYGWDALGSLGTFTVAIYLGLALVLSASTRSCCASTACPSSSSSPAHGRRSRWRSCPARRSAPCRSPSPSPSATSASRGPTRPSPCRSARRPRWTAARRSTRRSRRSSSRSSSASTCRSPTTS